jgi:hypothetical protein
MKKIFLLIACIIYTAISFSQTITSVVNEANTMEITFDNGKIDYVYKEGCKIASPTSGSIIYLIDLNKNTYPLDYTIVTSPLAASRAAMADSIQAYLNLFAYGATGPTGLTGATGPTGPAGGGGSSDTLTASTSAGILIESNNGTDVALFGAGGGAGATYYGGVNVTGALTSASWNDVYTTTVTVSSAELLDLFNTPKTLIAAPAAGSYISIRSYAMLYDYGGTAYANTGNNLQLRYTNAAGVQVDPNMFASGFLDATVDRLYENPFQGSLGSQAASAIVAQPLVLIYASSNLTTGNGVLRIYITYQIITTGF